MKHSLAGMAELIAGYYKELVEQGFTRDEALVIVTGWQRAILGLKQQDDG